MAKKNPGHQATVVATDEAPHWAQRLRRQMTALGEIEASSSTRINGDIVAWAFASRFASDARYVIAGAVARNRPAMIVATVSSASTLAAMTMIRSLVHRNGHRIRNGRLVAAHFADLGDVPFTLRTPQFLIVGAEKFGLPSGDLHLAIGCTWADMGLSPRDRRATVLARDGNAMTNEDVTVPTNAAISGMYRVLRTGKATLFSNAAWALEFMLEEHSDLVRDTLHARLADNLLAERDDVVRMLANALDDQAIAAAASGSRVVVFPIRWIAGSGPRSATAFCYLASDAAQSNLFRRHAEKPISDTDVRAAMAQVEKRLRFHANRVGRALDSVGFVTLRKGFRADVSCDVVLASFLADGFVPIELLLVTDDGEQVSPEHGS